MKYFVTGAVIVGAIVVIMGALLFMIYPLKYKGAILRAADTHGVDKVLIASIIHAESGFRADSVSSKGAVGLMQVMPATAEFVCAKIGIDYNEKLLFSAESNINIGVCYLKYLLDKFGDTKTVLIAYNAGEGKVAQWLTEEKYARKSGDNMVLASCPYKETNAYVSKVLGARKFYKNRF